MIKAVLKCKQYSSGSHRKRRRLYNRQTGCHGYSSSAGACHHRITAWHVAGGAIFEKMQKPERLGSRTTADHMCRWQHFPDVYGKHEISVHGYGQKQRYGCI